MHGLRSFSLVAILAMATPTTELYTFPYTTLFRSGSTDPAEPDQPRTHGARTSTTAALPRPSIRTSATAPSRSRSRSEEHTSELQSRLHLVCRLLLEKKNK